jgi:hypothetical protein
VAVGWLKSCSELASYKAVFSPVQDTAPPSVFCRRQQAVVVGIETLTEGMVPNICRRPKSFFGFVLRIFSMVETLIRLQVAAVIPETTEDPQSVAHYVCKSFQPPLEFSKKQPFAQGALKIHRLLLKKWPETGFREIRGDVRERDFWPTPKSAITCCLRRAVTKVEALKRQSPPLPNGKL